MATRGGFWREYRLVIGGSAVLWTLVLVGAWVGYRHFRPLLTGQLVKLPPKLAKAGVIHGEGVLHKESFLQDRGLGKVTAIAIRRGPAGRGIGFTVAGSRGALLADSGGRIEERVSFEQPGFRRCMDRVEPIPGRDGEPVGFLNRGSWSCPVARLDRQGRRVWTYGGGLSGVDDAAIGDLEGDGRLDVVVGFNGGGGVHRVDDGGHMVWGQADGNVWRVAFVDTEGTGRLMIVHSNADGLLTIRDDTGRVIRRVRTPTYLAHFSLTRWPGRADPALLQMDDDKIWVLDARGHALAALSAPRASSTLQAHGTLVRGRGDPAELFAVVGSYGPWGRSVLYVYAPDRALLYEEIISDICAGIAPLPSRDGGAEAFLVGCDGVVWRYDFK